MTIYQSSSTKSIFASVEYEAQHPLCFFTLKSDADLDAAKQMLAKSGLHLLTQSYSNGHTVLVAHGEHMQESIARVGQLDGGTLVPQPPQKKSFLQFLRAEGWKIRGGSSVIGQGMTLYSAFHSVPNSDFAAGKTKPTFDPATGMFAILNLAANFVNYIFGGQKEEDVHGLKKFDEIIASEVNHYLPDGADPVQPGDVRKLSYMNEEELKEHNKNRSVLAIIKQNSVRFGEVGLRTLGSIFMMFNYRKVIPALGLLSQGRAKEAFMLAKTQDSRTFLAGCGMVAGKMMGLFATTYDPNNPPKTYIDEIRQKVLWTTSSFTEMVAQGSVAQDRFYNKRLVQGNKVTADYMGGIGNIILTVPPYPTRLVLPYGKKVLDVDEVQARLLDELPKLPHDKIPEVAARVTAQLVEHLGPDAPSFGTLYQQLIDKLQIYHHITIAPEGPPPHQPETHAKLAHGHETHEKPMHAPAPTEHAEAKEHAGHFVEKLRQQHLDTPDAAQAMAI